jgi:hypothetical protein
MKSPNRIPYPSRFADPVTLEKDCLKELRDFGTASKPLCKCSR